MSEEIKNSFSIPKNKHLPFENLNRIEEDSADSDDSNECDDDMNKFE